MTTQALDAERGESDRWRALNRLTRGNKTSGLDLSNPSLYPLSTDLPADPLINRVPDCCVGGSATKLANYGEQLPVADLRRKGMCPCQGLPWRSEWVQLSRLNTYEEYLQRGHLSIPRVALVTTSAMKLIRRALDLAQRRQGTAGATCSSMDDRTDTHRRRIAHYRHLLADGVGSDLALHVFAQLASDEAELAVIERRDAAHRDEPKGAMKFST